MVQKKIEKGWYDPSKNDQRRAQTIHILATLPHPKRRQLSDDQLSCKKYSFLDTGPEKSPGKCDNCGMVIEGRSIRALLGGLIHDFFRHVFVEINNGKD